MGKEYPILVCAWLGSDNRVIESVFMFCCSSYFSIHSRKREVTSVLSARLVHIHSHTNTRLQFCAARQPKELIATSQFPWQREGWVIFTAAAAASSPALVSDCAFTQIHSCHQKFASFYPFSGVLQEWLRAEAASDVLVRQISVGHWMTEANLHVNCDIRQHNGSALDRFSLHWRSISEVMTSFI